MCIVLARDQMGWSVRSSHAIFPKVSHLGSERTKRFAPVQRRVVPRATSTQAFAFFNVLSSPEQLEMSDSPLPEQHERLYPPPVKVRVTVTVTVLM